MGETPYAEGQGDKTNPTLTSADFAAIAKVKAAGVPFTVVLFSGRPLLLTDASGVSAIDQANAFIAAWLPGTEGEGITDMLFGDYKPTGKLSFTWPASLAQLPIHDGDGQVPLFPYGYGLTVLMGTLGGFPNPPALWLRRAKPGYAYAIHGNPGRVPKPSRALAPPG